MGINFNIEYGDGTVHELTDESCFAKLKDIEEQAEWCDHLPSPSEAGGIEGVSYLAQREEGIQEAIAWYDYLKGTAIWGDNLRYRDKASDVMLEDGVSVATNIRPYHLLNTLSIYRHVEVFPDQVYNFNAFIEAGMVPDMAFIAACLTECDNDMISTLDNECPEHTVVAHKTFTARDYQRYVAMANGSKKAPTSRKDHTDNYDECYQYCAGGVATWLTYTDNRDKHHGDEVLVNQLLPKDYRIRYDKEAKKVLDIKKVDIDVNYDDVSTLVEKLNALHYSLIAN